MISNKRKLLLGTVLLFGTICIMSALCSWPLLLLREFPDLGQYPEVELATNDWSGQVSLPLCLAYVSQKQTLFTREFDSFIWQRLPSHWGSGPGYLLGFHHEAYYEREFSDWTLVRSSVFFNYDNPHNDVAISNTIVLDLPDAVCDTIRGRS